MRKTFLFGEVEEAVSEMDFSDVADSIIETDENSMMAVSGWWVFIPSLNMFLREGIVCVFDEDEKDYLPDFAVTVIMESELEEDGWIYYEQDGFTVSLGNYLNGRMGLTEIDTLECILCVPEGMATN